MSSEPKTARGYRILALQNSQRHLQLLAASTTVYGGAKKVLALQMLLTVGGGVAAAYVASSWPNIKGWTVFYAVSVSLLDMFVLERIQSGRRRTGAKIQEIFDCELFEIPQNAFATGELPTAEDISEYGAKFFSKTPDGGDLRDWYPSEIGPLLFDQAALACQRTNCWWDGRLRRRYFIALICSVVALTAGLFILGLCRHATLEQFFLVILAPLWPALVWGIREILKQYDAANSAEKLRSSADKLLERSSSIEPVALRQEMRSLQTEICRGRASRPFVFDWFNTLFRPRHQQLMQSGAAALAARLTK